MGKRTQRIYKALSDDNYEFLEWKAVDADMLDNLITGARILSVLEIKERSPIIILKHKHGDALAIDPAFGEAGEVGISKLCYIIERP